MTAEKMHAVMILPVTATTAEVKVGRKSVGIIGMVEAPPFEGFDGKMHMGQRWLPEGLPSDLPGPITQSEAALLLLALEGFDAEQAIARLRLAA